jgi:hypothetical protein
MVGLSAPAQPRLLLLRVEEHPRRSMILAEDHHSRHDLDRGGNSPHQNREHDQWQRRSHDLKNAARTAGLTVGRKYPYPSSTIPFSMNNRPMVHLEAAKRHWTPSVEIPGGSRADLRRVSSDRS